MRKFLTEFAVNMVGGPSALLQQDDLTNEEVLKRFSNDPCHIYMICRRPRISILPEDAQFTASSFEGLVTISSGAEVKNERFRLRTQDTEGFSFSSQYPFNTFEVNDRNGKRYLAGKTAILAGSLGYHLHPHLACEVVYVGQSYGTAGSRVAPDRLQSHSTLQQIYSDAHMRMPDKEIWIALWSFSPLLITSMDGISKSFGTSKEEDDAHIDEVLRTEITEQQRINFTEAALIRYFRPEYNTIYRESFPNPMHTSYSECYDLDINSVMAEIDTEDMNVQFWSAAAVPAWQHFATYALNSRAEREAMFDFASLNAPSNDPVVR